MSMQHWRMKQNTDSIQNSHLYNNLSANYHLITEIDPVKYFDHIIYACYILRITVVTTFFMIALYQKLALKCE